MAADAADRSPAHEIHPLHPDYYIVHISRHLPAKVLAHLEDLVKFNSMSELELKSKAAVRLFEETASELAAK